MEPAEYEAMFRLEDGLWWYVGMRRIIAHFLNGQGPHDRGWTLDAGCGTGGNLVSLAAYGNVVGIDFSPAALRLAGQRGKWPLLQGSVEQLPFRDRSFALVTCFDVICHRSISDDVAVLNEFRRVLKPGGRLLVRLPAYDWLYSRHDAAVHTRHRYTASELRHKLRAAGFTVMRISYANALLFPVAATRRVMQRGGTADQGSDVRPVAPVLNALFTQVLTMESRLIRHVALPFGLSVLALAERPAEDGLR